jgi:NAD(P)-dependent dehydrogenase (short-subunit alcohol dehydrogenase family)
MSKTQTRGGTMRLKGKVAIVTGGARGLGKAYALGLSDEGAQIVVTDILDATQVKREIEERGGEAIALYADVSEEDSVTEVARKTIERFGKIDILVNNAGIFADVNKKPFYEISLKEWEKIVKVNLTGTFLCCKAVYPQMKKQGKGKIVNVSSSTFFIGIPNLVHYVTSRGAIVAFTRALARELGNDGICVNAIAPGFTVSEAVQGNPTFPEPSRQVAVNSRCFKRDEKPEDLLGTIVFLASDESDFITGQTIVVDGGGVFH